LARRCRRRRLVLCRSHIRIREELNRKWLLTLDVVNVLVNKCPLLVTIRKDVWPGCGFSSDNGSEPFDLVAVPDAISGVLAPFSCNSN
jgi:hypothetical protein